MAALLVAIRFVQFAAAMAAFGVCAFRLYAFTGSAEIFRHEPAHAALDALLRRATQVAAVLALIAGLAIVPCVAAEMTGGAASALDPATLKAVMVATEFGHAWCGHLAFSAALVALCVVSPRRWGLAALSLAALLTLASLGWVGHAAMDMGGGVVHEINQMAHLTAAGLWLGGLLPLGILLHRSSRPDGAAYVPLARAALPHFSQIGYVAVALLTLTGSINSVMLVGSFHALVTTPYGRLLLVKIALFIAMVGLAIVNRFRLVPRLRGLGPPDIPLRALCRSVIAEQAIGLAILAVVAVLGTWPPANAHLPGMMMR